MHVFVSPGIMYLSQYGTTPNKSYKLYPLFIPNNTLSIHIGVYTFKDIVNGALDLHPSFHINKSTFLQSSIFSNIQNIQT